MTTESMRRAVTAEPTGAGLPTWREIRAQFGRPELAFDWLRVYLGIGLVVRGALFAMEPALLNQFINNDRWLFPMLLGHGLVLSHVVGGLMLAVGCCTRFAAAVQLPFVAGAVFLVHWQEGLLSRSQSLEFSALVLVMLLLYAVCGAADFSIDHYLRRPTEVATGEPALSMQRSLLPAPRVSTPVVGSGGTVSTNVDDGPANLREELAGTGLDVPPVPADARERYRSGSRELVMALVCTGVLVVLLGQGAYVAGAAWLIAVLVMFTIWMIGHARLD